MQYKGKGFVIRRLIIWGAVLAGTTLLAASYMDAMLYLLASPIIEVAWIGVLAWTLISGARLGFHRTWILSALCVAMLYAALPFGFASDVIRYVSHRPIYDVEISHLPADRPRWAEFNWGGMTFASRGVVYDSTDEIMLPRTKRSKQWLTRWKNTDLMCGYDDVMATIEPMGDHYYVTGFGC